MGGVIVLLTRGMGERLTYGILARYPVVLVERLGGLFFVVGAPVPRVLSLIVPVCAAASLSW